MARKHRDPGRRDMAKALAGKPGFMRDTVYAMRGDVPAVVEEDREFFILHQQWKASGGSSESPLIPKMRARWAQLTQGTDASERNAPRLRGRGRFAGCLTSISPG